jgi:hypothetical protein
VLDSLILVVLPNANPDANDPRAPDIPHDALRGATPEGAGIVGLLRDRRPQLVLDLRTNDDSTSDALSLVPTLPPGRAARRAVRRYDRRRSASHAGDGRCRRGGAVFHALRRERHVRHAGGSPDERRRTRHRVGIRVLTPARAPLARRIAESRAVVRAARSYVAAHRTAMGAHALAADTTVEAWGAEPSTGPRIPMRATDTITR